MDPQLYADTQRKLAEITDQPDIDMHLRIQEHRLEGYFWSNGRRYRIIGIRDEETEPHAVTGPAHSTTANSDTGADLLQEARNATQ
jgi:hypothetical protein